MRHASASNGLCWKKHERTVIVICLGVIFAPQEAAAIINMSICDPRAPGRGLTADHEDLKQ